MSSAWSKVRLAAGFFTYMATISVPRLVGNRETSTFSRGGTSVISSRPSVAAVTPYDGGLGGKNANFAAIVDVTPPISHPRTPGKAVPLRSSPLQCLSNRRIRRERSQKDRFYSLSGKGMGIGGLDSRERKGSARSPDSVELDRRKRRDVDGEGAGKNRSIYCYF
ncbi:hypothetical protein BHE74_00022350 [Ensete ventricosum]|nr:hypothetical protein GW17_00001425 [Ensete ventricosum]RWW70007.1 hypothetical protein BHE74_00022350 [Ensete ventricosum]RZS10166.1 hypothetical protein BHM03_00041337 [Ensete ventricosum]